MKIRVVVLCMLMASGLAFAAPPVPAGWHFAEWWDLGGRDRPDVMADLQGDGAIEMVTVAVRDDRDVMGLLLWNVDSKGNGKWTVLAEQKIPQSMANFSLEVLPDDGHANRSNILYCTAAKQCTVFAWDEESKKFRKSQQERRKSKG